MRVLIVDDHPSSRNALRAMAEKAGCDVLVAESGEEGIAAAEREKPQLVICDYRLPGNVSGLDVLAAVKKLDPTMLVVMITGHGDERLAVESLRLGASDYLNKPIRADYFAKMLSKLERVVRSQENTARVNGLVVSVRGRIRMPNDGDLVGPVVQRILGELRASCGNLDLSGIHLGLEEMVRNSLEHGNLEIGFEEKSKALAEHRLPEVIEERKQLNEFRDRTIEIEYSIDGDVFRCRIEDNGPGFDHQAVFDPLSDEGLNRLSGRGIFLTRAFFDEVKYSGSGNCVELVKRLCLPKEKEQLDS